MKKTFTQTYLKNKPNYWKIIAIFLLGIFISYFTMLFINYNSDKVFNQGYNKGVSDWNNQIIKNVNEAGEIPYIYNNTIQYLPIKQICDGR